MKNEGAGYELVKSVPGIQLHILLLTKNWEICFQVLSQIPIHDLTMENVLWADIRIYRSFSPRAAQVLQAVSLP